MTAIPGPRSAGETGGAGRDEPTARAVLDASQHDIARDGLDMTAMQMRLLQKVEELTLYAIDQHETIELLKDKVHALEADSSSVRRYTSRAQERRQGRRPR